MIWAENLPIFGNTHIIWAVQSLLKPTVLVTASITVADYFFMSEKKKTMELFQRITFCLHPNPTTIQHNPLMILVFFISKFKHSRPTPFFWRPERSLAPPVSLGEKSHQKRQQKNIKFDHSLPKKNAWGKELHDLEGVLTPFYREKSELWFSAFLWAFEGVKKGLNLKTSSKEFAETEMFTERRRLFFVLFHGVFFWSKL